MSEPLLIECQRTLLRDLKRLAADRARAETEIEQALRAEMEAAERELSETTRAVEERFRAESAAADAGVTKARERANARYEAEKAAALAEYAAVRKAIRERYEEEKEEVQSAFREATWTLGAFLEGSKAEAEKELTEQKTRLTGQTERLHAVRKEARALLEEWKQPLTYLDAPAPPPPDVTAEGGERVKLPQYLADVEELLSELQALAAPRWLKGKRFAAVFALVWLLLIYPLGLLVVRYGGLDVPRFEGKLLVGLAASTVATLLLGAIAHAVLSAVTRAQVRALAVPLGEDLAAAQARCAQILDFFTTQHDQHVRAARRRHQREVRAAQAKSMQEAAAVKQRRAEALPPVKDRYRARRKACARQRARDLRRAEQRYQRASAAARQRHAGGRKEAEQRHQSRLTQALARHDADHARMAAQWRQGVAEMRAVIDALNAEARQMFPPWDDPAWDTWVPPTELPPVLRYGEYRVERTAIPHAVPADPALRPVTLPDFTLAALAPFPDRYSLLLHAQDAGRGPAVEALRAAMYRLLTVVPPGKVRFTIIDPVGLGQNFAGLMHLADHDDMLVSSRIWTEAAHIEQRLGDLTAHMENVIQKYLRNRYGSITEYNAEAGEVAEPFRVLVVANFPVHFSEEAARRLVSIAQSGARCGVTTLVSVDTRQPLPRGFDLADLEAHAVNLDWTGERFRWRDPDFAPYPLTVDAPPSDEVGDKLLQRVGERAQAARRVEVPFEFIAPPPEQWWAGDSRPGLNVPLGRAGATRRQALRLGHGTSQHALVAGKTGSGKSTLLHALIVNLALTYSPDEVELYLIDFKKGVEFKTYATHELPHARVIAVESEREFGLSVLQRLDAELRQRGQRFRETGAQDLAAYRAAEPGARLPRILLVVDEFQEFFVEDDRIAQDAAGLLDRLVRQGRAFGLHVLLGSQTLGGAYSLARSTIDQMAVRVALQCSEADAQLILSADNSAARLLTRPGEAIYNDANGLVEGNHPFQVVWLPEARREEYLARLREMAQGRPPLPTVVFEGNAPADVRRNHLLAGLLQAPPAHTEEVSRRATPAWLGEAMALTDQTAAVFRRQNGSNLVIVGQQDVAALGMVGTAVLSLAAQVPPDVAPPASAFFYVVDGSQAAPPEHGPLARLADVVPQGARVTGWRDLPAILGELSAELDRRQKAGDAESPALYLVLYGLQRMRDLRRSDDDLGFMRRGDEPPSPAQQLATLLREGPALGVHTLIWCDTLNNLQRALDRQGMRELGQRVAMQMSVGDSSNLIDSPLASKLGLHRALLVSEEDGRVEKFRPYGPPPEEWLAWVKERLAERVGAARVG